MQNQLLSESSTNFWTSFSKKCALGALYLKKLIVIYLWGILEIPFQMIAATSNISHIILSFWIILFIRKKKAAQDLQEKVTNVKK